MAFNQIPAYDGEYFSVFWDANKPDGAISTYTDQSPVSSFQHTYEEYGEHIIKFSPNVKSLNIYQYIKNIDGSDEYCSDRIKRIEIRSPDFQQLMNVSFSGNLENLKLNMLSNINTSWYDCYELTSIELPELEEISKTYAVNCMRNLKRFYAPRLKRISKALSVFKGNISLEEIRFPQLTAIYGGDGYSFMTNVSLTAAYLPKLVRCLPSEFAYCVNLKYTDFSSLSSVENGMFRDCLCLKELKFPGVQKIGDSAFFRCQNLRRIDLSKVEAVPELVNVNAFDGMPADYEILVAKKLF